jgi:uncharacterized protein YfbU (UPF0304 family)
MKLSDGEKLILYLLSDIHEHLKIPDGVNSSFVSYALSNGNLWALERQFSHVLREKEPDPRVVTEVEDILEMWTLIEASYAKLPPAKRAQVDTDADLHAKPQFDGFDAHNHPEHLQVAECLIENMGRFSAFKGRELDSHTMSSVLCARRMWVVYRPIAKANPERLLSAQELVVILNARYAPAEADG